MQLISHCYFGLGVYRFRLPCSLNCAAFFQPILQSPTYKGETVIGASAGFRQTEVALSDHLAPPQIAISDLWSQHMDLPQVKRKKRRRQEQLSPTQVRIPCDPAAVSDKGLHQTTGPCVAHSGPTATFPAPPEGQP